jgi:hypothetical protein
VIVEADFVLVNLHCLPSRIVGQMIGNARRPLNFKTACLSQVMRCEMYLNPIT